MAESMKMPKPSEPMRDLFRAVLSGDPRVHTRPMFGNPAAFVNRNMFSGLFGDELFVRLPEAERTVLLREPGAHLLEPMAGRPMREYVVLPAAWRQQPEQIGVRMERALTSTAHCLAKNRARARLPDQNGALHRFAAGKGRALETYATNDCGAGIGVVSTG